MLTSIYSVGSLRYFRGFLNKLCLLSDDMTVNTLSHRDIFKTTRGINVWSGQQKEHNNIGP